MYWSKKHETKTQQKGKRKQNTERFKMQPEDCNRRFSCMKCQAENRYYFLYTVMMNSSFSPVQLKPFWSLYFPSGHPETRNPHYKRVSADINST